MQQSTHRQAEYPDSQSGEPAGEGVAGICLQRQREHYEPGHGTLTGSNDFQRVRILL